MPSLLWQCKQCQVAGGIDDAHDLDAVFAEPVDSEPAVNDQGTCIGTDDRAPRSQLRKRRQLSATIFDLIETLVREFWLRPELKAE